MPTPNYKRLSQKERIIIENRLKNGESPTKIAKAIGRPLCTVTREIKRNCIEDTNKTTRVNQSVLTLADGRNFRGSVLAGEIMRVKASYITRIKNFNTNKSKYDAKIADNKAKTRASTTHKHEPLLTCPEYQKTLMYIEARLKERWSPEQISGRIAMEIANNSTSLLKISYTTIYAYIYGQTNKQRREKLIKCLRRRGKPYRRHRQEIYNQTNRTKHSIHDRPEEVDNLMRMGDLEGDTIVGKDTRDRLLTHNDRVTGVVSISLILGFNANLIAKCTLKDVKRLQKNLMQNNDATTIKTITYDNGAEFSIWRQTEKKLNCTIYFADPYTPSQRGRNEHINGLIRDYLPKGTDFKKIRPVDIMKIEGLLNNRPRKRFGFLTPLEYARKLH